MGFWSTTLNIITIGGYNKLKKSQDIYKRTYEEYQNMCNKTNALHSEIKTLIQQLGITTKKAIFTLRKGYKLLKYDVTPVRNIFNYDTNIKFPQFRSVNVAEQFISKYEDGLILAKSAGIGTTAAAGVWTAVSYLGIASTGTAIGTLSGAAQTNAILACLGGGAIAAGGGGMALGTLVLGGIAIIPFIAFASINSYKSAHNLDIETEKLKKEINRLSSEYNELKNEHEKIAQKYNSMIISHANLNKIFIETNNALHPYGFIDKLWRFIRSIFGKSYYTDDEKLFLSKLDNEVYNFISSFKLDIDYKKLITDN